MASPNPFRLLAVLCRPFPILFATAIQYLGSTPAGGHNHHLSAPHALELPRLHPLQDEGKRVPTIFLHREKMVGPFSAPLSAPASSSLPSPALRAGGVRPLDTFELCFGIGRLNQSLMLAGRASRHRGGGTEPASRPTAWLYRSAKASDGVARDLSP
jgi:hypothetical protein